MASGQGSTPQFSPAARDAPLEGAEPVPANGCVRPDLAADRIRAYGEQFTYLRALARTAQSLSRVPVSGFGVGAVARGTSGTFYLGANLEFAGSRIGATVHAEQCAIVNAREHGESAVDVLAVTHTPCGHCRQFLTEIADAERLRIVLPDDVASLGDLLPLAFGPAHLARTTSLFAGDRGSLAAAGADLAARARAQAETSYAPYTRSFAGVALGLDDGQVIGGSYVESAAFNPSIEPLEAALSLLALAGQSWTTVKRVVLATVTDGPLGHETAFREVLGATMPHAFASVLQLTLDATRTNVLA